MKILWISNITFPEALSKLKGQTDLKASGGWMIGASNALMENCINVKLFVASVSPEVATLTKIEGEKITYYLLPKVGDEKKYHKEWGPLWLQIKNEVSPDVVHIHGTEYTPGLAFIRACGGENVVVSIQGMTSAYYYYYYGISNLQVLKNITIHDIMRRSTIFSGEKEMRNRSKYEVELLKSVNHIIGRTSWDKANTWAINPKALYHFCNETLRDEFYTGKWEFDKCVPHSIMLSQAAYPIKGAHMLLKALPLILREFPDTKVKIAGPDILRSSSSLRSMRISGYAKYLEALIEENHLDKAVTFLGPQNAEGMKDELLNSNVFVLPSTIDNSPNSLGEAQLLGVPCVCSYVGGVADMIPSEDCGYMYRFEEVNMLAQLICFVFKKSESFDNTIMRKVAAERHNASKNAKTLYDIYTNM